MLQATLIYIPKPKKQERKPMQETHDTLQKRQLENDRPERNSFSSPFLPTPLSQVAPPKNVTTTENGPPRKGIQEN